MLINNSTRTCPYCHTKYAWNHEYCDCRGIRTKLLLDNHTFAMPGVSIVESCDVITDDDVIRHEECGVVTAKINLPPRIYIASKTKHANKWKRLRTEGYNIISTWIDEAGEGQSSDYRELSIRCIREIRQSDFLVLYCETGEILKGALIEAGVALAFGMEVRCIGKCDTLNRVFQKHPNWKEYSDIYLALEKH